jgi:hypothetical protein
VDNKGTMSLNIFLMMCILGIDFMIYVFFQWVYGDKRRAIARKVAACRKTRNEESSRPFVVAAENAANLAKQSQHNEIERFVGNSSTKALLHASYRKRIA